MSTSNKFLEKTQVVLARDNALSVPCPLCGAPAGEHCRSGGQLYFESHRTRRQKPAFQHHPEWVLWWKSMKVYEQHSSSKAMDRPTSLRVPSQAEILAGAR